MRRDMIHNSCRCHSAIFGTINAERVTLQVCGPRPLPFVIVATLGRALTLAAIDRIFVCIAVSTIHRKI